MFNVTVRVTDSGSPNLDDFETIQITVGEVNVAPVLAAIGNKAVNEGNLLTFTLLTMIVMPTFSTYRQAESSTRITWKKKTASWEVKWEISVHKTKI